MLQHQTGRAFDSPYSANQQQVSRVIQGPPVTTTGPTNQSQESEVSSPRRDENESAVNRSQFNATSNISSAQGTDNHGHTVTSAVSNTEAISEYHSQSYHSAVNQATTIAGSQVSHHQITDPSGKTITVTAGQPTSYNQNNPMKPSEQSATRNNMSQGQQTNHPYFMSGTQPMPSHQYHPTSMFSMSQGQMMYNPHQHPSPWMSNTLQGISGPGGHTTLPYTFNPHPQLPAGIPPYSTVGIPMRPYELANVIQPQLDSFKQPPSATNTGRQVQSDTVYSDPASENHNRYARAKNEPSRHTLRRERRDQAD